MIAAAMTPVFRERDTVFCRWFSLEDTHDCRMLRSSNKLFSIRPSDVRPNGGKATLPVFCRRVVTKIGEPNAERSEVVRSTYDRHGYPALLKSWLRVMKSAI